MQLLLEDEENDFEQVVYYQAGVGAMAENNSGANLYGNCMGNGACFRTSENLMALHIITTITAMRSILQASLGAHLLLAALALW